MVAPAARPGEIREFVITTMLTSDDVFNVKRRIRIGVLGQAAVFTASAGSLPNIIPRICVHALFGMTGQEMPGFRLQQGNHIAFINVVPILRVFIGRQSAFVGFTAKLLDAIANLFVGSPINDLPRNLRREAAVYRVKKSVE
jgi:hypothetical protein